MSKEKVELLRKELEDLMVLYNNKKEELSEEIEKLQKVCPHDVYIAEDNCDTHKPGYYYTCKYCEIFTMSRPVGLIEYK